MKKAINPLLFIALLLAVFTVGVMIGRFTNYNNVTISVEKPQVSASEGSLAPTNNDSTAISYKLNINTATADELQELPGIGPALAQRIIAYRTENGPFNTINDLLNVSGIGEKKLAAITDHIIIGG